MKNEYALVRVSLAAVCNAYNVRRHLIRRPTLHHFGAEAMAEWAGAAAAD